MNSLVRDYELETQSQLLSLNEDSDVILRLSVESNEYHQLKTKVSPIYPSYQF